MLLGANGCGKSTLLRCLAGLLKPQKGCIRMQGCFGFVFQNPDQQVVLPSVFSDVGFGLGRCDLSQEEITALVLHSLDRVGMAEYLDAQTSSLSGGQKQRVAIAGTLAQNPDILLLDELTTFLDGVDQKMVVECVQNIVHPKKGLYDEDVDGRVTALWVTHRLEELRYADRVTFMDKGRVVWTTDPEDALKRMKKLGATIH